MSLSSPSGGQGDNVEPLFIRQREPTCCCSLFLGWLFNEEDLPHPRLAAGITMLQSKPMRPRRKLNVHAWALRAKNFSGGGSLLSASCAGMKLVYQLPQGISLHLDSRSLASFRMALGLLVFALAWQLRPDYAAFFLPEAVPHK